MAAANDCAAALRGDLKGLHGFEVAEMHAQQWELCAWSKTINKGYTRKYEFKLKPFGFLLLGMIGFQDTRMAGNCLELTSGAWGGAPATAGRTSLRNVR